MGVSGFKWRLVTGRVSGSNESVVVCEPTETSDVFGFRNGITFVTIGIRRR